MNQEQYEIDCIMLKGQKETLRVIAKGRAKFKDRNDKDVRRLFRTFARSEKSIKKMRQNLLRYHKLYRGLFERYGLH